MDPDVALEQIRQMVRYIRDTEADNDLPDGLDVYNLAELVEGLDAWITGGGFLPSVWAEA